MMNERGGGLQVHRKQPVLQGSLVQSFLLHTSPGRKWKIEDVQVYEPMTCVTYDKSCSDYYELISDLPLANSHVPRVPKYQVFARVYSVADIIRDDPKHHRREAVYPYSLSSNSIAWQALKGNLQVSVSSSPV